MNHRLVLPTKRHRGTPQHSVPDLLVGITPVLVFLCLHIGRAVALLTAALAAGVGVRQQHDRGGAAVQGDVHSQKQVVGDMKQRLARAEAAFVEMNTDTGRLRVKQQSLLGHTLQELCRSEGGGEESASASTSSAHPVVAVEEIRTLLRVLRKATTLTDQESEPKNEEASRVLKFFMSTLLNGTMKQPKELEQMRSLTTVRPPPGTSLPLAATMLGLTGAVAPCEQCCERRITRIVILAAAVGPPGPTFS